LIYIHVAVRFKSMSSIQVILLKDESLEDIGQKNKRITMKVKQPRASMMPGAWICSMSDRGRKSIKNGKVYLDDNTEFLIELYNPLTSCILCDIKLNGQSVSSSGLVLRPGQRFYLDCFPDDKKKFVFKTYEVENTNQSMEAIAKNGLLEVRFFKEEVVNIPNYPKVIEKHYHHYDYYPFYRTYPYWLNPIGGSITTGGCFGSALTTNTANYTTLQGDGNLNLTSGSINISNSYSQLSDGFTLNNVQSFNCSSNIETGRIEKGSSSSQQFTEIDMQFQSMCITSVVLQILPESRRPIDTRDIIQPKHKEEIRNLMNNVQLNFCENCGNKLKGSENFCPSCGKKLK